MIQQTGQPTELSSLAYLSRNSSVISSFSDSDSEVCTTTVLETPPTRPTHTFSSPRSRSSNSPPSQSVRPPPAYLSPDQGAHPYQKSQSIVISFPNPSLSPDQPRNPARLPTRFCLPKISCSERPSVKDRIPPCVSTGISPCCVRLLSVIHFDTGRAGDALVALAEKNILVKLWAGHPGIIRLHWAFQDDWSLCVRQHPSSEKADQAVQFLCWTWRRMGTFNRGYCAVIGVR
jgi:3-phosphoinositide dependent protein kinase-1